MKNFIITIASFSLTATLLLFPLLSNAQYEKKLNATGEENPSIRSNTQNDSTGTANPEEFIRKIPNDASAASEDQGTSETKDVSHSDQSVYQRKMDQGVIPKRVIKRGKKK